jgi:hypothetical protein
MGTTVTVTLVGVPVPPAFLPATVYVVVVEGDAVQLCQVLLPQVPPVQT